MKVALAQINATVGDLDGNLRLLAQAARQAHADGACLVVAPELSLTGYPPEDLLLRPAFVVACAAALASLARELADCEGLQLVVGHPHQVGQRGDLRSKSMAVPLRFNAASVLSAGQVVGTYCKRELPNYQVFDERRYFASGRDAGQGALVIEAGGLRFGILICEDAWFDEPARAAVAAGAQVLCVINASPFHLHKSGEREARMAERAIAVARPLLYAHLVGGQDEVVFDGASFAVDAHGRVCARAPTASRWGRLPTCPVQRPRPGRRWSPACATTSVKTASRGRSSDCQGGLIRPWCWRWPWTPWAPTKCGP